jgi:YfiH family protein
MIPFTTDPGLSAFSWIVHGFGTRWLDEAGLQALAAAHAMRPVLLHQIHSNRVLDAAAVVRPETDGDALITDKPGLLLVVKTADCLPILLVDPGRRAVAAVHAGWRGTAAGIASAAVAALQDRFGSRPGDLWAGLGPSIGPGCYEVGKDVAEPRPGRPEWRKALRPIAGRPDRFTLDLPAANRDQIEAAGVSPARIGAAEICTHCSPDLLSWRRDHRADARLYSFIGIRPLD